MSQPAVVIGESALSLLGSRQFIGQWKDLLKDCPWATVFQSPSFCIPWFRVYEPRYEPVLVIHRREDSLDGLLVLSRDRKTGVLTHAGTHHAEYQTWICRVSDAETFPREAFVALRQTSPKGLVRFLFLAPGTPLEWTSKATIAGIHTDVRFHKRGLMRVGPDSGIEASLRKSSNKSRLARLKGLGPVTFSQLHTVAELSAELDEIVVQCDVRQGGVHGTLPFSADSLKRTVYLAWMAEVGIVHATALRLGSKLIASHVTLINGRSVPLGLVTYAPEFGKHSPGKLLLLLLGRMLGEQGYDYLDLTPGGDYKDRFACDFDQVAVLDVFLGSLDYARHRARRFAISLSKRIAKHRAYQVANMAKTMSIFIRRYQHVRPSDLLFKSFSIAIRRGRLWARSEREYRLYVVEPSNIDSQFSPSIRINCLADTLLYQPASPSAPSLTEFLRTVVSRLESGQILFTAARPGLLLYYSWLIPRTIRAGSDYGHDFQLPFEAAVLWDAFAHPSARGQGLHTASLLAMTAYAFKSGLARRAIAGVRAENIVARHSVEKVGFKYIGSAWLGCRWGRKTRWTTWVEPAPQP